LLLPALTLDNREAAKQRVQGNHKGLPLVLVGAGLAPALGNREELPLRVPAQDQQNISYRSLF